MAIINVVDKGQLVALLTAVSTGTSNTITFPKDSDNPSVEVTGAGTISGGTVIIEENMTDPAFAGTWSQIQSITASGLTGGASQVVHIIGNVKFLRVRVSSNITGGGTISANVLGA